MGLQFAVCEGVHRLCLIFFRNGLTNSTVLDAISSRYHNDMDARKTKISGRGVLAHIRNIVIERYLQPKTHEYPSTE